MDQQIGIGLLASIIELHLEADICGETSKRDGLAKFVFTFDNTSSRRTESCRFAVHFTTVVSSRAYRASTACVKRAPPFLCSTRIGSRFGCEAQAPVTSSMRS